MHLIILGLMLTLEGEREPLTIQFLLFLPKRMFEELEFLMFYLYKISFSLYNIILYVY